jgi:ribosomal-protein-alanine N-acetyltransferase
LPKEASNSQLSKFKQGPAALERRAMETGHIHSLSLTMNIRTGLPTDVSALQALALQSATAAHWTPEQYAEIFRDGSVTRRVLVAEDADGIAGFVVALAAGPEWEIENIVVPPIGQRKGTGTQVINELVKRAQAAGAESIFLEVRESNAAARGFYESTGFVESGRRPGYYSEPSEGAVLYRLAVAGVQH